MARGAVRRSRGGGEVDAEEGGEEGEVGKSCLGVSVDSSLVHIKGAIY